MSLPPQTFFWYVRRPVTYMPCNSHYRRSASKDKRTDGVHYPERIHVGWSLLQFVVVVDSLASVLSCTIHGQLNIG